MKSILITGMTGTLGSNLVSALYRKKYLIFCLVRPWGKLNIRERVNQNLNINSRNVKAISGDITKPFGGVSAKDIKLLVDSHIDLLLHCAASIKFDKKLTKEIEKINVDGTKNIISLAKKIKVKSIHHVSTAYVAGDAKIFNENDFDIGQKFRNPYEKTKKEAEAIVRNTVEYRKSFTIYRPSIIVGDSESGKIASFDGLYGYLKFFWRFKRTMVELKKSNEMYVINKFCRVGNNGRLYLPISIKCSNSSTLNLIPIDWLVSCLVKLIECPSFGQTYHLVHESPPKVRWIFEHSLKLMGIYGIKLSERVQDSKFPPLFDFMNKVINIYSPYITHEPKFGLNNLKTILGDNYNAPPAIDEFYLRELINFAIRNNFSAGVS